MESKEKITKMRNSRFKEPAITEANSRAQAQLAIQISEMKSQMGGIVKHQTVTTDAAIFTASVVERVARLILKSSISQLQSISKSKDDRVSPRVIQLALRRNTQLQSLFGVAAPSESSVTSSTSVPSLSPFHSIIKRFLDTSTTLLLTKEEAELFGGPVLRIEDAADVSLAPGGKSDIALGEDDLVETFRDPVATSTSDTSTTPGITTATTSAAAINGTTAGGGVGWNVRRGDAVGAVELATMLKKLHPVYVLTHDTIAFLTSLFRCLVNQLCEHVDASLAARERSESDADSMESSSLVELLETAVTDISHSESLSKKLIKSGRKMVSMHRSVAVANNYLDGITIKLRRQEGVTTVEQMTMKVSGDAPLSTSFQTAAKKFRVKLSDYVFLYNGQLVDPRQTPSQLDMKAISSMFAVSMKWWNFKRRDDARRGLLTTTRSNDEQVRNYKKLAASKVKDTLTLPPIVPASLNRKRKLPVEHDTVVVPSATVALKSKLPRHPAAVNFPGTESIPVIHERKPGGRRHVGRNGKSSVSRHAGTSIPALDPLKPRYNYHRLITTPIEGGTHVSLEKLEAIHPKGKSIQRGRDWSEEKRRALEEITSLKRHGVLTEAAEEIHSVGAKVESESITAVDDVVKPIVSPSHSIRKSELEQYEQLKAELLIDTEKTLESLHLTQASYSSLTSDMSNLRKQLKGKTESMNVADFATPAVVESLVSRVDQLQHVSRESTELMQGALSLLKRFSHEFSGKDMSHSYKKDATNSGNRKESKKSNKETSSTTPAVAWHAAAVDSILEMSSPVVAEAKTEMVEKTPAAVEHAAVAEDSIDVKMRTEYLNSISATSLEHSVEASKPEVPSPSDAVHEDYGDDFES